MLSLFFFDPLYQGFVSRLDIFLSCGFQVEVTLFGGQVDAQSILSSCVQHSWMGCLCKKRKRPFLSGRKKTLSLEWTSVEDAFVT